MEEDHKSNAPERGNPGKSFVRTLWIAVATAILLSAANVVVAGGAIINEQRIVKVETKNDDQDEKLTKQGLELERQSTLMETAIKSLERIEGKVDSLGRAR